MSINTLILFFFTLPNFIYITTANYAQNNNKDTIHEHWVKNLFVKQQRKKEVVLPAFTVVERLTLTGAFPLTTVIPRIP